MIKSVSYLLSIALTIFALVTLFMSSSVIFDWFEIRALEGDYVLFIVWANFICSIIYLVSVYGLLKLKKWSYKLLVSSAIVLIIAMIGLYFHIDGGGKYEDKTVAAMIFRTGLTLIFLSLTYLRIEKWDS